MLYRRAAREHGEPMPVLWPYAIIFTKAGKIKKVLEYINAETGEILPNEDMPVLSIGDKVAERVQILESLRPEVRSLAEFVLKFSNKRRGITPGIDELCRWYAELAGKRPDNVRRHIKTLLEAKVLMNENLLGPAFQRTGRSARDHLSEAEDAAAKYLLMCHDSFNPINGTGRRTGDPALVAEEVVRLEVEALAERALWAAQGLPKLRAPLTSMVLQPA